ncbi:MAG: MATE family efflux transporter [Acidobacteriota bacterium]
MSDTEPTPPTASASANDDALARPGLWRDITAALRGETQDGTRGPLGRAVLLLSIPMILELALESVFALVDAIFVSRLGSDAVAAVGITESLLTLVYAVAIGLSAACTAMVARRTGEHDPEMAARSGMQAVLLALFGAAITGTIGVLMPARLLRMMGASEEVVAIGVPYTTLVIGGSVMVYLLFIINAAFRGAGDAGLAMRALWVANLTNIVLDPILIFGLGPIPAFGLTGAGIATVVGRGVGVGLQVFILVRGRGALRPRFADVLPDRELLARLLRIAWTGVVQYLLATASWVVLVRLLSSFGSSAIAGYTLGLRVLIFLLLPGWGMSNAAATLVGQNLGAGQPERAARAAWITTGAVMIYFAVAGGAMILFGPWAMGLLSNDPIAQQVGIDLLRIMGIIFVFDGVAMVMTQALNGAGDTATPSVLYAIGYWAFQLPLAWLLALQWDFGPRGVIYAIAAAQILVAAMTAYVFQRGRWKQQVV